MSKLAIVSDLHVDINQFTTTEYAQMVTHLQNQQVTHLHIAGDIANTKARALDVIDYFSQFFETTFHWGNHEMADLVGEAEIEAYPDPRFLNFSQRQLSNQWTLIGMNGWYDYSFAKQPRDFSRFKQLVWYDRKITRELSDPQLLAQLAEQLDRYLATFKKDQSIIFTTHFVPHHAFVPEYKPPYEKWGQMNAFLGSEKIHEILIKYPQVKEVVFGHTHRKLESQTIDGIRYYCRSLGYMYEWPETRKWLREYIKAPLPNMAAVKKGLSIHHKAYQQVKPNIWQAEFAQAISYFEF